MTDLFESTVKTLLISEAILTGAAVSYFAHGVVQEYYNPALTKERPLYLRFEYGYGLFIGKIEHDSQDGNLGKDTR